MTREAGGSAAKKDLRGRVGGLLPPAALPCGSCPSDVCLPSLHPISELTGFDIRWARAK